MPQPAGRLWERNLFLFEWTYWPFSLNKGTRVQPQPAHFVYLLLQPEPGKDLGSRRKEEPVTAHRVGVRWRLPSPTVCFALLCKYGGPTAGSS